jgi:hypothetical protein
LNADRYLESSRIPGFQFNECVVTAETGTDPGMGRFDIFPPQLRAGDVDALVRQLHLESEPLEEMQDRPHRQSNNSGRKNDRLPFAQVPKMQGRPYVEAEHHEQKQGLKYKHAALVDIDPELFNWHLRSSPIFAGPS